MSVKHDESPHLIMQHSLSEKARFLFQIRLPPSDANTSENTSARQRFKSTECLSHTSPQRSIEKVHAPETMHAASLAPYHHIWVIVLLHMLSCHMRLNTLKPCVKGEQCQLLCSRFLRPWQNFNLACRSQAPQHLPCRISEYQLITC